MNEDIIYKAVQQINSIDLSGKSSVYTNAIYGFFSDARVGEINYRPCFASLGTFYFRGNEPTHLWVWHRKTEDSLTWMEFLVGPDTPWAGINQYLVNDDPKFCDEYGFVFRDVGNAPYTFVYNFLQATRMNWEYKSQFTDFLQYRKDGIPAKTAVLLVAGFHQKSDQSGFMVYPSMGGHFPITGAKDFAYRWLNSKPVIPNDTFDKPLSLLKTSVFLSVRQESSYYDSGPTFPDIVACQNFLYEQAERQRKYCQ